jgi:chromosome partitioning protein
MFHVEPGVPRYIAFHVKHLGAGSGGQVGDRESRCTASPSVPRETPKILEPGPRNARTLVPYGTGWSVVSRGTLFSTRLTVDPTSVSRGTELRNDVPRETYCFSTNPSDTFRNRLGDFLARVIAIANQKGGVGKTTTAVNLGASLAVSEKKTLIIDSDSQANTTSSLGFAKDPSRRTLYQGLILGEPFERLAIDAQIEGLDLIPSDKNLVGAAVELVGMENREYRLRDAILGLRQKYEFIIIDCPPTLDLLTLNALAASDAVLVPIQCEYLAIEGVSELLDTLMRLRRTINPALEIEGILLTMYDDRTTLSKQVAADLRSFFGDKVFETVIPRNVRLAEAPSHGMPVIFYDIHSKGAEAYIQLAKEVVSNVQKRVGQGAERPDQGAGAPAATAASAATAGAGSGGTIGGSGSGSSTGSDTQ